MKKFIRRTMAAAITTATLMSALALPASAASVGTGSKTVASGVKLTGKIDLSWYTPVGGVNIYTVKAITNLENPASGSASWSLHSGIDLDNYSTGALIQRDVVNGGSKVKPVTASVSGAYIGVTAKAFTSHEVRGAYSGVLYLSSSTFTI